MSYRTYKTYNWTYTSYRTYSTQKGVYLMVKVKTFASPLKIFETRKELEALDAMVNKFIEENKVQKVISVSDACTQDKSGSIGVIRVVAYE